MRKIVTLISTCLLVLLLTSCGKASQKKPLNSDIDPKNYEQLVVPNNALAFQLLAQAPADEEGNFFVSPTSLQMALSMVYQGASGETKEEIGRLLGMEGIDVESLQKANAALIHLLEKDRAGIELSLANSIWLNESYHFQKDFQKSLENYFNAKIEEIDVFDAESAKTINRWVSDATNGKIKEMVDAPLNPDLVAYLLNAIYFKGNWTTVFDEERTTQKSFTLASGEKKDVAMMSLAKRLHYVENDLFQAVQLPYGEEEIYMHVFLPREGKALDEIYEAFTLENWATWQEAFQVNQGTIELPKFQLSYETKLNDLLKSMGMQRAFEREAEFTQMVEEDVPVWISEVKQKTYIDVNEKGTEAAAVTGVEFVTESAPIEDPFHMVVDRPFIITITDATSDAILFIGTIAHPMEKEGR